MEDLVPDAGEPGEEQEREDVRIDQRVEQPREEARMNLLDPRASEPEDVTTRFRLHTVGLSKQRRNRRSNGIDDVHPQRLRRGRVRGLAYRYVRPMGLAAVALR